MVLKAFLSKLEPERREALVAFLPENKRRVLETLPTCSYPVDSESTHFTVLEKVHWSWFLPTLKSYSEMEQKLFLSALNPYAAKNLAKALTLSLNGVDLTEVARSYLRKLLLDSLTGPDPLLPSEYLPISPMNLLLPLSKKELREVIDLLSMYDLATELRQIVETKILKKIYSLLTEEEKKLLKHASSQKDPFSVGRIGVDRWDGSEESLRKLLHRRGLTRLGAGLSGENPDLIWYVCHQLDIGRGTALHKGCAKEAIQGVTDVIQKQIEELL